jgi:hypothetical protein
MSTIADDRPMVEPDLRDFRTLWVGQSISAFGSQVTTLALPLTRSRSAPPQSRSAS